MYLYICTYVYKSLAVGALKVIGKSNQRYVNVVFRSGTTGIMRSNITVRELLLGNEMIDLFPRENAT